MDVEVEHPHHHHRTGHRWFDLMVPLAALFVSLVSIGIAFHHGEVMQGLVDQNERLVQANSLPFLQLYGSNPRENGKQSIALVASNRGVGPAEIRAARLLVDGTAVADLRELIRRCCGGASAKYVGTSTLLGQMLRPGEDISYIQLPGTAENKSFIAQLEKARRTGRIVTELCYCSVFDECWWASSKDEVRPRRVAACEIVEPQYRQ